MWARAAEAWLSQLKNSSCWLIVLADAKLAILKSLEIVSSVNSVDRELDGTIFDSCDSWLGLLLLDIFACFSIVRSIRHRIVELILLKWSISFLFSFFPLQFNLRPLLILQTEGMHTVFTVATHNQNWFNKLTRLFIDHEWIAFHTEQKPSLCSFYLSTDVPATLLCSKVHHSFILHIMVLLCFAYCVCICAHTIVEFLSTVCLMNKINDANTELQRRRITKTKSSILE